MRFSKCLGWTLAFALGAFVATLLDEERRRGRHAQERSFTDDKLNVWDSEGGNIPAVQTVQPHPEDPTLH